MRRNPKQRHRGWKRLATVLTGIQRINFTSFEFIIHEDDSRKNLFLGTMQLGNVGRWGSKRALLNPNLILTLDLAIASIITASFPLLTLFPQISCVTLSLCSVEILLQISVEILLQGLKVFLGSWSRCPAILAAGSILNLLYIALYAFSVRAIQFVQIQNINHIILYHEVHRWHHCPLSYCVTLPPVHYAYIESS